MSDMASAEPATRTTARPRPAVVCVTPVLNEAWILERFLACAALWADHIVIADQGSTDRSREIAACHPKVHLVENPAKQFNEPERQRLLIEAARALVPGARVLVALDADEALTANWENSAEWARFLSSPPGTIGYFEWVNVLPGAERCWIPDWEYPFAYVDDGRPHQGLPIHSPRVPVHPGAPSLRFSEVKCLHFAATDWARMKSRQRWYQCWEVLQNRGRRPAEMYRQYHHMDAIPNQRPLDPAWIDGYRRHGIDVTSTWRDGRYRWDRDVLQLFAEHGPQRFRRVDVWDVNWQELATVWEMPPSAAPADPRGVVDRAVARWLRRTQGRHGSRGVRMVDRLLRIAAW